MTTYEHAVIHICAHGHPHMTMWSSTYVVHHIFADNIMVFCTRCGHPHMWATGSTYVGNHIHICGCGHPRCICGCGHPHMWMWSSSCHAHHMLICGCGYQHPTAQDQRGDPADDEKAQRRLVANYSMRLTLNRLVAILGEKRTADSDGRGDDDNSAMLAPHDASHLN